MWSDGSRTSPQPRLPLQPGLPLILADGPCFFRLFGFAFVANTIDTTSTLTTPRRMARVRLQFDRVVGMLRPEPGAGVAGGATLGGAERERGAANCKRGGSRPAGRRARGEGRRAQPGAGFFCFLGARDGVPAGSLLIAPAGRVFEDDSDNDIMYVLCIYTNLVGLCTFCASSISGGGGYLRRVTT